MTYEEYVKLDQYFAENSFVRQGIDCYPKYRLLLRMLYWTGMRIGEVIALTYADFEGSADGKMRISVTKSYNSVYKLLKETKNDKTRKIPLPEPVIELYLPMQQEHLKKGEEEEQIFTWNHGACTAMIKKACREAGIWEYNCHSF